MRFKRAAKSLAITSVVAGGVLFSASPALAGYTDCQPRGYACMWVDPSYPVGPDASFSGQINLDNTWWGSNNAVSSVVNNGYCGAYSIARYYDAYWFTGSNIPMYCPESGLQSRDPNLSNGTNETSANWDNKISSGRFEN